MRIFFRFQARATGIDRIVALVTLTACIVFFALPPADAAAVPTTSEVVADTDSDTSTRSVLNGGKSGYVPVPLTPELEQLLVSALENEKLHRPSVARRICVLDIESAEQQVPTGTTAGITATTTLSFGTKTNFVHAFEVSGCDVAATLKTRLPVVTKSAVAKELGWCSEAMQSNRQQQQSGECVPVRGVVTVSSAFVSPAVAAAGDALWSGASRVEVASIILQPQ